jgi:phosphopantothenoylcysteine decarboxylase/phosphopantothenate--cysteine ligase
MGSAIASEAVRRGWAVTLLMGPAPITPTDTGMKIIRFRTCADLERLLVEHAPHAEVIVMAAAVADYRPKVDPAFFGGKFRRKSETLTLDLEPTPDLLAGVAARRGPSQLLVGFALEPRAELLASARDKLVRKKIDLVVGNPLETMDSDTVEAVVLDADGREHRSPGMMSKTDFAPWLLTIIEQRVARTAPLAAKEKA